MPVAYPTIVTLPITGNPALNSPTLFDATGWNDISDNLIAWIAAHVPNGASTYSHTKLVFPTTTANHYDATYTGRGNAGDGHTTNNSTTITTDTAFFVPSDTGRRVVGVNIDDGATMTYVSATQARLSSTANATASGVKFTVDDGPGPVPPGNPYGGWHTGFPTNRAQYRIEGGLNAAMPFNGRQNITIDGGGTGTNGTGGAELLSVTKLIYVNGCSNPNGKTGVDGSTTATDSVLTSSTTPFTAAMVGAELGLVANMIVYLDFPTWSSANGGTQTYTTLDMKLGNPVACPFAVGLRLDQIAGFTPSGWNSPAILVNAVSGNTFSIYNQGTNPGPPTNVAGTAFALLSTQGNESWRVVTSFIDSSHITYSGSPYGDWGNAGHPFPKPIRWEMMPRIAAPNYVAGTYQSGDRVLSGGKVWSSNTDNNTSTPSVTFWTSLGSVSAQNQPNGAIAFMGPENADYSTSTPAGYSGSITYTPGDVVTSGGTTYTSLEYGNTGHTPPNTAWWAPVTTVNAQRGQWQLTYAPDGRTPGGDVFTGSNAIGSAYFQASQASGKRSGGRNFFHFDGCTHIRVMNMEFTGSFPGGAYDPKNEAQNAFLFRTCTDMEVGNVTVTAQWGNSLQTWAATGTNVATIGLWVHDSRFNHFGRQVFSFAYGGNLIIERNIVGGSSRTLMDVEPVVSGHDPRLTNQVDGLFLYHNTVGHHGLGGLISMHDISNFHAKGNIGETLGSGGTTWVVNNCIYDFNEDTADGTGAWNQVSDEIVVSANSTIAGPNIWVHDNVNTIGRNLLKLALTGEPLVASSMNGVQIGVGHTVASIPIDQNGQYHGSPPVPRLQDLSTFPPSGRIYVGPTGVNTTWFDYSSRTGTAFTNCVGGGTVITMAWTDDFTATALNGLNGPTNYRSINNSFHSGSGTQLTDDNPVDWATYGGANSTAGVFAPFTVEPAFHPYRDDASGTITQTVSPTSGAVGSTVLFSGTGYTAGKTISGTFAGSALTLSPASPVVASDGTWSATFVVPNVAAGAQAVDSTDSGGASAASVIFTITAPPAANVGVAPTHAVVGTTVTLSGTGYVPTNTVSATFAGAPVTLTPTNPVVATNGTWSATFVIPASSNGVQTIVASDGPPPVPINLVDAAGNFLVDASGNQLVTA